MGLALCGMMGCGKTTVGKILAKKTGNVLVDTDAYIEERHGAIADIFERCGEAYFRDLETELLKEITEKQGLIISTGGGMVLRAENVALLKKQGKVVYLHASAETLERRLKADSTRPLLKGGQESLAKKIARLMNEREETYQSIADFTVDTDDKTAEEIAEEILGLM